MSLKQLQVSEVYEKNYDATTRMVVNQGSSRSGKTYSILQVLISRCMSMPDEGHKFTIVRKESTTIRSTVLQDFQSIMQDWGLWNDADFNKVVMEYRLNGNLIEFIGANDGQKLRGAKRDTLYVNEANELGWESMKQLMMRTTGQVYLDYNPSITKLHWLYSNIVDTRDDVTFIHSTYKDNPFLEESIVNEIERLQHTDPDAWRIYGLGELGVSRSTIFVARPATNVPEDASLLSYGLDFGYTNDPTALVAAYLSGDGESIYLKELAYSTGLTNDDIVDKFHISGISNRDIIYADSAEPKSIDYLRRKGFNIRPTKKGADSIMSGIDTLKRYKIYYIGRNLEMEFTNYRWKEDINGESTNTPIDRYNHAIDAVRYATWNVLGAPKRKIRVI